MKLLLIMQAVLLAISINEVGEL